jgi:NADPH:quinone reductase-like Zn-dependent oxidoreductase
MRAITISSFGSQPTFTTEHPLPSDAKDDQVTIRVLASGLHPLVRAQTAGTHHSIKTKLLPYVLGTDGIGITSDGRTVYFNSTMTGGGFAEKISVSKDLITPLPKGSDPTQLAGLVNPGLGAWMAFKGHISPKLRPKFNVLVVGVTGLSGKLAVMFARSLGAGKIIGVARDDERMIPLDLDRRIVLASNPAETDFSDMGDLDLILDYLYGPVIPALFNSLNSSVPVQYLQIGTVCGADMCLPGALLRTKNITIRGSGPGAWPLSQLSKELPDLLEVISRLPDMGLKAKRLEDVETAWLSERDRTVFVI